MGESIVLLLCNGDDALFTVLTDCYCQNKGGEMYNHLETLFDSQGVKKIDAFIWTHPDKDHSVDIERMLTSYDSEHTAEIFIPNGLVYGKESYCGEAQQAVEYIYRHYSPKGSRTEKRHIHTVSTEDQEVRNLLCVDIFADEMLKPITCKFRFVLPNTEHCAHADYWDLELKPNQMSIVYSVELNGRSYVFTSDLVDAGTKKMGTEILTRMNYLKIPHHGSDQSNEFLALIRQQEFNCLTSTATRFNPKGDPKAPVLRAYSALGNVYFITDSTDEKIGCIETIVDVANDRCTTHCEGNASVYSR